MELRTNQAERLRRRGNIMGDRAMAEIRTKEGSLYFYTHWHGESLPTVSKEALRLAQPRITDEIYALRIIVDQLIKNAGGRDLETGCGLMFHPNCEDEYNGDNPSVLIDLVKNKVSVFGMHNQEVNN